MDVVNYIHGKNEKCIQILVGKSDRKRTYARPRHR
jgi:hypothetical protein